MTEEREEIELQLLKAEIRLKEAEAARIETLTPFEASQMEATTKLKKAGVATGYILATVSGFTLLMKIAEALGWKV